jgi:hypothetical protein
MMESQNPSVSKVKVKCPQCRKRLCDRTKIGEGWCLLYKKGKIVSIMSMPNSLWLITCGGCDTTHKVDPAKGIIESYRAEKYDDRTRA